MIKIPQRTQRSLFGEILDWMLTPLLLLWPLSLALTWLVAQNLANKPFDRALVYNVQALAQFIQVMPGPRARFSLPQPASELLRAVRFGGLVSCTGHGPRTLRGPVSGCWGILIKMLY